MKPRIECPSCGRKLVCTQSISLLDGNRGYFLPEHMFMNLVDGSGRETIECSGAGLVAVQEHRRWAFFETKAGMGRDARPRGRARA